MDDWVNCKDNLAHFLQISCLPQTASAYLFIYTVLSSRVIFVDWWNFDIFKITQRNIWKTVIQFKCFSISLKTWSILILEETSNVCKLPHFLIKCFKCKTFQDFHQNESFKKSLERLDSDLRSIRNPEKISRYKVGCQKIKKWDRG